MAIGFPSSPFNKKQFSVDSKLYEYNSTLGAWSKSIRAPVSPGTATITDISNLVDGSNLLNNPGSTIPSYATEVEVLSQSVGVQDGQMAYAEDTDKLYVFSGYSWYKTSTAIEYVPPPPIVLTFIGDKAVWAGGLTFGGTDPTVAYENQMTYFSIANDSASQDFGDLTENHRSNAAASDGTYLYVVGGTEASGNDYADTGERVTFATAGVASVSSGGIQAAMLAGAGDGTYGYFIGGHPGSSPFRKNISRIDIANGTSMTASYGTTPSPYGNNHGRLHMSATSNGDNLFINGGYYDGSSSTPTYGDIDTVDVMATASGGEATTYGTISSATQSNGAVNDAYYTVFYATAYSGTADSLQYYNMSTGPGSTISTFGDLGYSLSGSQTGGGISDGTTGVFGGVYASREVKKVTIASAGNASTWGNLHKDLQQFAGGSGT